MAKSLVALAAAAAGAPVDLEGMNMDGLDLAGENLRRAVKGAALGNRTPDQHLARLPPALIPPEDPAGVGGRQVV